MHGVDGTRQTSFTGRLLEQESNIPLRSNRISNSKRYFFEIQRYLHFTDNSLLAPCGSPTYNKLGKIETILKMVTSNFRSVYNLHRDVSVDEAMIPFKGRSTLKQYLPKKPVKRGIKV